MKEMYALVLNDVKFPEKTLPEKFANNADYYDARINTING